MKIQEAKESADCDCKDRGESSTKITITAGKKIRFFAKTSVYLIRTLDEYTDKEIESYWCGDEDQKRSQADLIKNIQDARSNTSLSDSQLEHVNICTRGIEHLVFSKKTKRRRITKEQHIDAVLDEQEAQWNENVLDEDALRAVSLQHSKAHQDDAILRASQDAAYVMRHVNITRID